VPAELANWGIAALVMTIGWTTVVLVVGRFWRSQEKVVLVAATVSACFVMILALAVLVGALAQPARLTVRNESQWPIEVSGLNIGAGHVVQPGDSEVFFEDAGPLWTGGFIDDVEISGGPTGAARVRLSNMDAGKTMEIVVSEATLGVDGNE